MLVIPSPKKQQVLLHCCDTWSCLRGIHLPIWINIKPQGTQCFNGFIVVPFDTYRALCSLIRVSVGKTININNEKKPQLSDLSSSCAANMGFPSVASVNFSKLFFSFLGNFVVNDESNYVWSMLLLPSHALLPTANNHTLEAGQCPCSPLFPWVQMVCFKFDWSAHRYSACRWD